MQRLFLFLIFSLFLAPAFAQVSFQFIPEIQGRNVDGLFGARIISATAKRNVSLSITVSEQKRGKIFSVRTPAFSVNPGNNSIPSTAVRPAKILFAQNSISQQVQQSGLLPEGEYEYCFTLIPQSNDPEVPAEPMEQCFTVELTPFSPLNLNEPANQDKICQQRPLFTWQPTFPVINGAAYQLQLTEIKENQSAVEALNYNLPLINQNGIVSPALPYPNSYKELRPGKKYAWQVSLYKNQTVLNRSEVWEFEVDCKDSVVKAPTVIDDGYREIDDLSRGNYYIATQALKISLFNPYGGGELDYRITCVTSPNQKIRKLPKVFLQPGKNKVNIELSKRQGFVDGNYYILNILLPGGSSKSLRFLYKEAL